MGVAHAHHGFVNIDARNIDAAELESLHHVVVCLLCIEVCHTWQRLLVDVGGEWRDTVSQTLLYEVVT